MGKLTANQLVALNLRRARELLGLTQEEAAERLAPYIGERWSRVTWSAAERSIRGERIRAFTGDDIVALAAAFDLPISFFLQPAGPMLDRFGDTGEQAELIAAPRAKKGVTPEQLTKLAGPIPDEYAERIATLVEQRQAELRRRLGIDEQEEKS